MTLPLICYACGIILADLFEPVPFWGVWPVLWGAAGWLTRRHWGGAACLGLFFLSLGLALGQLQATAPADSGEIYSRISDQPQRVEGLVRQVISRPGGGMAMDLECRTIFTDQGAIPVAGTLRLYGDALPEEVGPGDRIRFLGRLRQPRSFGTPGEFDFPRHLARQGIFVTAYVGDAKSLVRFARPPQPTMSQRIEQLRFALGRQIDRAVGPEQAGLVRALVIGDKGKISAQQRELLGRGGVSHLFAISGLHLGLIAAFLYLVGRSLYGRSEGLLLHSPPQRLLPLLLLPLLALYLLLTGDALPTRRAFFIAAALAALALFARRTPPLRLLAAVAFAILLASPLALFEPAFQLSFAGVLGILVLLPRWQPRIDRLGRPLRPVVALLAATLAATVTTTPLVLAHFHLLAPAGLLTNLLAVPAIGLVAVPLGLVGALCAPGWEAAAALLFQGCALVVTLTLHGVAWVTKVPLLTGWTFYATPIQLTGILLGLLWLLWPRRTLRPALIGLLFGAAALAGVAAWPAPPLAVTALSVGQGDAFLVSRGRNRHLLVDGGGLYSDTFDVGERLIAPALGRLGISTLEAILLTHDHPDHRKGLVYILETFPVGAFWTAQPPAELHPSLTGVLARRQIPIRVFPSGWTAMESGAEGELALFVPQQHQNQTNDRSVALYARHGADGVLLTGDLEASGVKDLLAATLPGLVSLLKLPHHGSRHSAPELLTEACRPQLAMVSLGRDNRYRFPHAEVTAHLDRQQIPLWRTDQDGSLRFRSDGRGWQVQTWQQGFFIDRKR